MDTTNSIPLDTTQDKITDNEKIDRSKISVTRYSFVSTVDTNKEYFTRREI